MCRVIETYICNDTGPFPKWKRLTFKEFDKQQKFLRSFWNNIVKLEEIIFETTVVNPVGARRHNNVVTTSF